MTAAPALEEAAREHPEPGTNLEDTPAGGGIGLGEDRFEDLGVGEEVLRERVTCAQAGGAERVPDVARVTRWAT